LCAPNVVSAIAIGHGASPRLPGAFAAESIAPVREESQDRAEVALRAAGERIAPTAFGAVTGVIAGLAMPRTTEGVQYFGVVAQILPVLLLALAIEARLFGGRARRNVNDERNDRRHYCAGTMELGRQHFLNLGTVLVLLLAEVVGLIQLSSNHPGTHQVWLQNAALVWGFATVAALAFIGQGAPRLIASLEMKPHTDTSVVVQAVASNEYGDKDVSPLLNFLVPNGVSIDACDANGNPIAEPTGLRILHTHEELAGVSDWKYPSRRLLVSAGDATVDYFLLEGLVSGRAYPLVLRYDHVELPKGRVQVQLDLRMPTHSVVSGRA
jgi:hypothetical protein